MEPCAICLELTNTQVLCNCNCKFDIHKECLETWINLNNTCIICKYSIYFFDKNLLIKFKYLDREFGKSKIIYFLDYIMNKISYISTNIESSVIRVLLFNIIFEFLMFLMLISIFVYMIIISQIKYSFDYIKGNQLYGEPIIFIKKIEK